MGRFFQPKRILLAAILVCFEESSRIHDGSMLVSALSMPRRPPRIRPKRQSTITTDVTTNQESKSPNETKLTNTNNNKHQQALGDPSLLTGIRFSERTDLSPFTKEALKDGFGLETMTVVQASTYEAAVAGRSILAKSKTGSGKTLAFLLPILERLVNVNDNSADLGFIPGRSIGCLILAPTRELAIQIADQAEILVDYHNRQSGKQRQLKVACIYGGVKMQRDVRLLTGDRRGTGDLPTILVSTPSRLLEHLEGNSPLQKNFRDVRGKGNKSRFAMILAQTKIVVLDETDRLLQKSNLKETQKVLGYLARTEKRQTLLFSATFPRAVRRLLLSPSSSILGKASDSKESDFLEVDCYEQNEKEAANDQKRIEESFVNLENMSQFIPTLLTILRREQQRDSQNYKILVFFPAGRLVRFLFQFFTIGGLEKPEHIWEIHSRMSQSSRTRASSSFRTARKGILFSSDVSARGLDYPDVSLVVQMGAPSSDQDYVHRIGRTGRAGKIGKSLLVLLPFEQNERKKPRRKRGQVSYRNDDSLEQDLELASWLQETDSLYKICRDELEPTLSKVRSGHVVLTPGAQASYKTFLAHYTNRKVNQSEILGHAQDFVEGVGLAQIPELEEEFASKLGLSLNQSD